MTAPSLAQRPSKALLVGLVVSGVLALIVLAIMLRAGGPVGFGLSALLAVAPLPVLLAAVLSLDRLEPEPRLNLAFAFAWGAGVAIVLGIALTLAGQALFARAGYGTGEVEYIGTVVLAPVVEEAFKGSALLLLLRRRKEIDGLTDGIVYASMAGLGFAAVENVGYYLLSYGEDGIRAAVQLFVLRGLIDPLGHPIYTSMIGLGVAYALTRRTVVARYAAVPLGYLAAVLLHGLWNGAASARSLGLLSAAYLVIMGALIFLIVVTVRERRQLIARMGHYLPVYEETGLVSPADLRMLTTLTGRKAARQWARRKGFGQAMSDYQHAATELTMLHVRAERQGVDPDRFQAERDAYLGAMADARRWQEQGDEPCQDGINCR
ncbi:Membrane proteinase PrsW, cleaves anti-sigma factor RsiW, M82 family [Nonomuraea maritima]|uniref:Membrane proteinase PrsW, cleaves anti-sigma factor RsiW, M82 family n=1 Tax=Nonomuraea maritima TaxID=683260 RepID=A0A1G9NMF4_9ACTN|nr:PrsW family intramembrane metalloprotease [Nonomuraea maritima]SDL87762.1 Membrane proteinase PrsW, cleaves anti-sigma factor RsiW, M82 family [Nonomuraea maritima]